VALVGAGSAATILQVSGVFDGAVLDLNGVNTSDFQGFTIECDTGVIGSSRFDIGIRYWWDQTSGASYNNTFRDIQIWGARFKIGIQVGSDLSRKSSGQEDQTYWYEPSSPVSRFRGERLPIRRARSCWRGPV
jgi:hypothetical protein